jgi:hypothetical protein
VLALAVVGLAALELFWETRGPSRPPHHILEEARSLHCPGTPPPKVKCDRIRFGRWRCTLTSDEGSSKVELGPLDVHQEFSQIC